MIRNIAILTSGGDAPGLNAAIRAAVTSALFHGMRVYGIRNGFEGLMSGDFIEMDKEMVQDLVQRGGTILQSSRSPKFKTSEGRKAAYRQLAQKSIEALIVIGGDGTMEGIKIFQEEFPVKCVGIPKTIDNDLSGTDYCIGFDTAVNTAMQAIDKIRDTAESHHRIFLVEVMGRDAGYIALHAGIATGAEAILLPETRTDLAHLRNKILEHEANGHRSIVAVLAEGDEAGGVVKTAAALSLEFPGYTFHTCVLGHIQRGGSPTCSDRVLAAKLGLAAVDALLQKTTGIMVGEVGGQLVHTPFYQVKKRKAEIDVRTLSLLNILSA